MIKLVNALPDIVPLTAEGVRILSAFNTYGETALFWVQDEKTVLCSLDGDMTLLYRGTDVGELKEFLNFINPKSIFANYETLQLLGYITERVYVYKKDYCPDLEKLNGDAVKSDDVYSLLCNKGFLLPPFPEFATDYCRKLNLGSLSVFALKDTAVALGITENETLLITGVASNKKGFGTVALNGLLAKGGYKTAFCVTKKETVKFYEKNGFAFCYEAGYVIF